MPCHRQANSKCKVLDQDFLDNFDSGKNLERWMSIDNPEYMGRIARAA